MARLLMRTAQPRLPTCALLAVLGCATGAGALDPQYSRDYAHHSTQLQNALLANYNTNVPPVVSQRSAKSVALSDAGTDVALQIRVFKVESVDAAHGKMQLKVWFRQTWKDERLAWNESAHGGVSMIALQTDPENQQLWVPDLQPYNVLNQIDDTLAWTTASVYSDGSIFWSRPGMLELMCKFSGLVAFPYDKLKCSLEVGGWTWSGSHQGIEPSASGAARISAQEATAGSSYNEYTVIEIEAEPVVYEYPCCPSEPWPVIFYTVTLDRAESYYEAWLILPYVLLTLVSFLPTLMSHEVGERLSFGITLILAIEVSKTLFQHMIPVCGELVWLELFMMLNLVFCIIALAETCLVLFLAYHSDPHIVPQWFVEILLACLPRKLNRVLPDATRRVSVSAGAPAQEEFAASRHANQWSTLASKRFAEVPTSVASKLAPSMGLAGPKVSVGGDADDSDPVARISLFERYFCELDKRAVGYIAISDAYSWFTFTCCAHAGTAHIWSAIDRHNADGDETLVCGEFVAVCCELLWSVPVSRLEVLHETHRTVSTQAAEANVMKWRRWAKWVDRQARLWIPATYLTLLFFLMNVELGEPGVGETGSYRRAWSNATLKVTTGVLPNEMFDGIWSLVPSTSWSTALLATLAVPVVVIVLLIAGKAAIYSARSAKILQSAEKERSRAERSANVGATGDRMSRIMSARDETDDEAPAPALEDISSPHR